MAATTRAALPYPILTDTPDVPRDVKALADRLDLIEGAPGYTTANLPTLGVFAGRLAWATDTGNLHRYDGAVWDVVVRTTPPRVKATLTGVFSLANITYTDVLFNAEDYDPQAMHSTVTATERITIAKAGLYHISGSITYASNATGTRKVSIVKNNSIGIVIDSRLAIGSSTTSQTMSADVYLAAGDYITMQAFQSSGGALTLDASQGSTWLAARWVCETV